jgi:streptomycin 6-kinase
MSRNPGRPTAHIWREPLPDLAASLLDRRALRPDGPSAHGHASSVLPVR